MHTEKTAKAPAAIGGLFTLYATLSIVIPKVVSRIFPSGGARKPGKTRQNSVVSSVKRTNLKLHSSPEAGAATSSCARSSPRTACVSGSRRDHRAHAIQFSKTGSRARSPSGPDKGSSRIFSSLLLLLLLFYYDFIVIQIRRRSDPGKEKYKHDGYPPLHIAQYHLPMSYSEPSAVQSAETPSLRATVSRHRHTAMVRQL